MVAEGKIEISSEKIEQGHYFVWCNEAPVYETVPPERWKKSVILKRALLRGKVNLTTPFQAVGVA